MKTYMYKALGVLAVILMFTACSVPSITNRSANTHVPAAYHGPQDTTNTARINWKEYFADPYLHALIDSALSNNQELHITLQQLQIYKNDISARKGEYLPSVTLGARSGVEKRARYTPLGAMEATTHIEPGKEMPGMEMPEPLPDFMIGAFATWEVDIWRKLRNAKKAATMEYLASLEGRNFMVTNLVAEIADAYYQLLALDSELAIIQQNIRITRNVLQIVRYQKQATRATELAVKRFEAQLLNIQGLQYDIQQEIIEAENHINFLVGRFPQPVQRSSQDFNNLTPPAVHAGIPAQLLQNRPDIRQAELELEAAKLDVKVARAQFYPSLGITAGVGYQAFNPSYLLRTPESMLYSLAGDLVAPLVNRNAIKAGYRNANARQLQAVIDYEQTILRAYIEVVNQLSAIDNLAQSYDLKQQQVQVLNTSIDISNDLFRSTRADYMEVLMTQRDALESKFQLIELKKRQLTAIVTIYQALGGGWTRQSTQ
ncbi:TolC family protein [Roseivirga sp. BDSF3-8]|uniref:TolC family protein n=1 Tax=Roseivirga sp. BDSF3-8 TaxID=3241598 RepID=UPI0035325BD0